jgi:hypothetical protein
MVTQNSGEGSPIKTARPHPGNWPVPAKALVTMAVVMMSLGLLFAGGQVVVHDIIPTLFSGSPMESPGHAQMEEAPSGRGDLFGNAMTTMEKPPFYKSDEFIFALKFTHIHTFGMSAIFILMGAIVFFLNLSTAVRTWLIILPFVGIIIDLAAVWLKLFVHPAFFWLHMPGGILFGIVFTLDVFFILSQMWIGSPVGSKINNKA